MKTNNVVLSFGLLTVLWIIAPSRLFAQAAPGPMPRAQSQQLPSAQEPAQSRVKPSDQAERRPTRPSISGSWKLNSEQSDDARTKIMEAQRKAEVNNGPYGNGPYGGGPIGGRYPSSGSGPWGGGPYGGNRGGWGDQSDLDLQRMQEFIYPAVSLAFAIKDAEIDLTDDRNRKRVFYTDGRKLAKPKGDDYREIAAHWEGRRLVSQEKSPDAGELRRSFDLAPDGRQLYEIVYLDATRSRTSTNIRPVYDIASDKQ